MRQSSKKTTTNTKGFGSRSRIGAQGSLKKAKPSARRNGSKSSVAKSKSPLVGDAIRVAKEFEKLHNEVSEAAEGVRMKLYSIYGRCYVIARGFKRDHSQYQQFKEHPFWSEISYRPKDRSEITAVVKFVQKRHTRRFASNVTKITTILKTLPKEMRADEVAAHIKAAGGIEKLYGLSKSDGETKSITPDDLDLLIRTDDDNEIVDDSDEGADEETNDGASWEHARESETANRATSDNVISADFGGKISPQRAPSIRSHFDEKKHILVDVSAITTPEDARKLRKLTICAVVRAPLDCGFEPIVATSVKQTTATSARKKRL